MIVKFIIGKHWVEIIRENSFNTTKNYFNFQFHFEKGLIVGFMISLVGILNVRFTFSQN